MKKRNQSKLPAIALAVILFVVGILLIAFLPRTAAGDDTQTDEREIETEGDSSDSENQGDKPDDDRPIGPEETSEEKEKGNNKKLYSTFPLFTGYKEYDFIEKLIAVAKSQLGESEGAKGYTKFGEFFGHPYEAWCTEYVMWCIDQTEKETGLNYFKLYYPKTDYSGGCVDFYSKRGWFFKGGSSFVPRRGDIVVFDYDFDGVTDHTGLVTGVEYDESEDRLYILIIEGNIPEDEPGGIVRERRLAADWNKIYGYGTFLISE